MLEFINLFLQVAFKLCAVIFIVIAISIAFSAIKLMSDFQKKEKEDKNENGDE